MTLARTLAVTALSVVALGAGATSASASYDGGGWGGGGYNQLRAVSYINSDAGVNTDVAPNSSCYNPDQYDMQKFSTAASGNPGNNNVHNDACFLDGNGNKVGRNIGATFRSSGTGYISACPDPDGAGPAVAVLRDLNGDGRNDSCFQSSYQQRGIAGDFEYHVRVNNTGMTGQEQVTWGMDRDGDGRIDSSYGGYYGYGNNGIKVDWSATGLTGAGGGGW